MSSEHYEILCSQNDERWHEFRTQGISASNVAAVMGLMGKIDRKTNKWTYYPGSDPETAIAKMISGEKEDLSDNAYVAAGQYLERPIMDWAEKVHGEKYDSWQQLLRSKKYPWLMATPDGIQNADDGAWLIEVKTHSEMTYAWKTGVPEYVVCQVQVQLAVTGLKRAKIIEWCYGKHPQVHIVQRSEEAIEQIAHSTKSIWDHIVAERAKL